MKKALGVAGFLCAILSLSAFVHHVPADFGTIQAALDVCVFGDSVLVSPGVYLESLTWPATDGITLCGDDPLNTIVDANQAGRVITFPGTWDDAPITSATWVRKLTLRNGFTTLNGSGIYCNYASPSFKDCIVAYNSCPDWSTCSGGGLYCYHSWATFDNVYFVHNTAYSGGGMHIDPLSSPHFTNCVIADNTLMSPGGSFAAGIYARYEVYPLFTGCTITRNRYSNRAAIHLGEVSSAGFINCVITDNQYGFQLVSDATVNVSNSTITNHDDAALLNIGSGAPDMVNNWWGSITGPYHATNPSGTGDELNGGVFFNPWLNQPHPDTAPPPPQNVAAQWTMGASGHDISVSWDPCPEGSSTWWVHWGLDSLDVVQTFYQSATENHAVITGFGPQALNYVQVRASRDNEISSWMSVTVPVWVGDVASDDQLEAQSLLTVQPNPIRGQARVAYAGKIPGSAELRIYNQRGQLVRSVAGLNCSQEGGSFLWDGSDNLGRQLPSGIYLFVLSQGKATTRVRALLLK